MDIKYRRFIRVSLSDFFVKIGFETFVTSNPKKFHNQQKDKVNAKR